MVAESGFFVGQVGAQIRLDTEDDLALIGAATVKKIHYQRPETGATGSWTATVDGSKLTYTTTAITDLPVAGEYILQAYLEGTGWKLVGKKVSMIVGEPIVPIT